MADGSDDINRLIKLPHALPLTKKCHTGFIAPPPTPNNDDTANPNASQGKHAQDGNGTSLPETVEPVVVSSPSSPSTAQVPSKEPLATGKETTQPPFTAATPTPANGDEDDNNNNNNNNRSPPPSASSQPPVLTNANEPHHSLAKSAKPMPGEQQPPPKSSESAHPSRIPASRERAWTLNRQPNRASAMYLNVPAPGASSPTTTRTRGGGPAVHNGFILPKLRLQLADLLNPGTELFLNTIGSPIAMLERACTSVLTQLYDSPSSKFFHAPSIRSITIVVRSMAGVAHTVSNELDCDHKEVHISLEYIMQIHKAISVHSMIRDEIEGVLTHEMVHCLQYSNECRVGLLEGIADWVRMRCGLIPRHWKRELRGPWDAGYHHTAFFLQYVEDRFGKGTIRKMNEWMRTQRYDDKRFWEEIVGWPVGQLWQDYSIRHGE